MKNLSYAIGDKIHCTNGNYVHLDAQASKINTGQNYHIRAIHIRCGNVELENVVGVFSPKRFTKSPVKKQYHDYSIVTRKRRVYSIIDVSFTAALARLLTVHKVRETQISNIERLELVEIELEV